MADDIEVSKGVKARIVKISDKALNTIEKYLEGDTVDPLMVANSFKLAGLATKVMQMEQVRIITERSHALRLLPYLPDKAIRKQYIMLTNPQLSPLLMLKRGDKKSKES